MKGLLGHSNETHDFQKLVFVGIAELLHIVAAEIEKGTEVVEQIGSLEELVEFPLRLAAWCGDVSVGVAGLTKVTDAPPTRHVGAGGHGGCIGGFVQHSRHDELVNARVRSSDRRCSLRAAD